MDDLLENTRFGHTQTYQCQLGNHIYSEELSYCTHCGYSFDKDNESLSSKGAPNDQHHENKDKR